MRRANLLSGVPALGAMCLAASSALAQEGGVTLVFGIEQRFESGSNIGLDVPATGSTNVSATRLSFGLTTETQIDRLEFNASSALLVENSFDIDGTEAQLGRPDLSFGYTREIPNAIFSATAAYRRDDVDAFDDDITAVDEVGTRSDSRAEVYFETGRTAPLGFAASASYALSDYEDTTDPDLNDTETVRVGLRTLLRFSDVMVGTVGLSFEREQEDDLAQTVTETSTAFAGLEYSMPNGTLSGTLTLADETDESRRVTFEVGRSMVLLDGEFNARIGVTTADDSGTDLIGAVEWTRAQPDGGIGVSLERTVSFDDETEVDTTFAVDWRREVNAVSSFAVDFSYEVSDSPSERIEQAEIGAAYGYALTEAWNLDTGIRYRVREDNDGRAESPSIFVALGRSFVFRP